MDEKKTDFKVTRRNKEKLRTVYACLNCRHRKVKCDRVQPCHACCLRGIPDECTYAGRGVKRNYMAQADAIMTLRDEFRILRAKLHERDQQDALSPGKHVIENGQHGELNSGLRSEDQRYSAFETIVTGLAISCPATCDEIVDQIRAGTDLAVIATSTAAALHSSNVSSNTPCPWSGSVVTKMVGGAILSEAPFSSPTRRGRSYPSIESGIAPAAEVKQERRSRCEMQWDWGSISPFFIDKFINDFAPSNPWRHRSTTEQLDTSWLQTLAHSMSDFPLAKWSLQSAAMAYCGKLLDNQAILLAARNMYASSLRSLQNSLASAVYLSADSICNVLTMLLYELIDSSCQIGPSNHLDGAGKLLERLGPYHVTAGIQHRAFLFFRFRAISYAIITRKPTFLSSHQWKTIPWSLALSAKSPLHHLLDVMADIPELLQRLDDLKKPLGKQQMYLGWNQPRWLQLLNRVEAVISSLELWRVRFDAQIFSGEVDLPAMNHQDGQRFSLPPFPGKDPDGSTVRYYSNGYIVQTVTTFYACKLVLYDLQAQLRAAPKPGPGSIYELSSSICRSLEYHLCYTPPGWGILWIFFPLWQVYQTFPENSPERAWIDEVLRWMDDKTPFEISHLGGWRRNEPGP